MGQKALANTYIEEKDIVFSHDFGNTGYKTKWTIKPSMVKKCEWTKEELLVRMRGTPGVKIKLSKEQFSLIQPVLYNRRVHWQSGVVTVLDYHRHMYITGKSISLGGNDKAFAGNSMLEVNAQDVIDVLGGTGEVVRDEWKTVGYADSGFSAYTPSIIHGKPSTPLIHTEWPPPSDVPISVTSSTGTAMTKYELIEIIQNGKLQIENTRGDSTEVQKILFKLGCKWQSGKTKTKLIDIDYITIGLNTPLIMTNSMAQDTNKGASVTAITDTEFLSIMQGDVYRFKTEDEFVKEFGSDWRYADHRSEDNVSITDSMLENLGKFHIGIPHPPPDNFWSIGHCNYDRTMVKKIALTGEKSPQKEIIPGLNDEYADWRGVTNSVGILVIRDGHAPSKPKSFSQHVVPAKEVKVEIKKCGSIVKNLLGDYHGII